MENLLKREIWFLLNGKKCNNYNKIIRKDDIKYYYILKIAIYNIWLFDTILKLYFYIIIIYRYFKIILATFFNSNKISDKLLLLSRYFPDDPLQIYEHNVYKPSLVDQRPYESGQRSLSSNSSNLQSNLRRRLLLVARLDTIAWESTRSDAGQQTYDEGRASDSKSKSHCAVVYSRGSRVRDAG